MKKFKFKELGKKIDFLNEVRLYEWAGICTGLTFFLVTIQACDLLKKQEVTYQDAASLCFTLLMLIIFLTITVYSDTDL